MITMTILVAINNLAWMGLALYLIWVRLDRPKLIPRTPKEIHEPIEEASDGEILRAWKGLDVPLVDETRYDVNEIPIIDEESVE
jgi:hypothetical protein